jgi:hypothetical protein
MDGNSQKFPLEIWLGAKFWPIISGPRFLTQIFGSFTNACTTKQVKGLGRKLVRAEIMRISFGNFVPRRKFRPWGGISNPVMTHKYRGSQQSSREVKPKFIDSTQGEPKNIYKP